MNKMHITLIMLILAGCASTVTKPPQGLKVITEKESANCEFKGDVHGVSMFYGMFAGPAISKAQKEAYAQAISVGANSIVWLPVQAQYGGTSVHGNAYYCQ